MLDLIGSILMTLVALVVFGLLLFLTVSQFRASERAVNGSRSAKVSEKRMADRTQVGTPRSLP